MRATPTAFLCLALVLFAGLACMGIKKPWRSYSQIPFSSEGWLAGDHVERGRMNNDMFRNPKLHIATRDEALQSLGEPDIKKTIEGKEVWFYRVELGFGPEGMDLIPISFDQKGRGSFGYSYGDTGAIMAKESEL
jgi:hypothetical protein